MYRIASSLFQNLAPYAFLEVVRQITKSIFLLFHLAIPQTPKPIGRCILDVEVFTSDSLQRILKMADRSWINTRDLAGCLVILVPASTRVSPGRALEVFLCPDVVVFYRFFSDFN